MEILARNPYSVVCPGAYQKYNEKSVRFSVGVEGEIVWVKGKFLVERDDTKISIDGPSFAAISTWETNAFHLPQQAVDAIRPSQTPGFDFEIVEPVTLSKVTK